MNIGRIENEHLYFARYTYLIDFNRPINTA